MADTQVAETPEQTVSEPAQRPQEMTFGAEHFAPAIFGGEAPIQQPQTETKQEEPKPEEKPAEPEEEILEPAAWLKSKWGWESEEDADKEIKELREMRTKTPEQQKWENEQSKKIHELLREGKVDDVMDFYAKQKQIEKYTSGELNENNAADVIKLSMKLKYDNLTDAEIDYKYNKQYGFPRKPTDRDDLTEDENKARIDEWEERVNDIKMGRMIDAKLALPELQQAKTKIVLPDINADGLSNKQPSPEDLAAFEKDKQSFLENSGKVISDFGGFNVQVKDKDVDYSVSYAPSKEEREAITNKFKEFAESGFDANSLFAQRWVNEDRTLNVGQMVKDYLRLQADDKALQKLVNDAAGQRLELYLKEKKNININETKEQMTVPSAKKDTSQILQENFWGG